MDKSSNGAGKLAVYAALFVGQQVLIQGLCIIGFIVGLNAAGGKVEVGFSTTDKEGRKVDRVKTFHPWNLVPQFDQPQPQPSSSSSVSPNNGPNNAVMAGTAPEAGGRPRPAAVVIKNRTPVHYGFSALLASGSGKSSKPLLDANKM